MNRLRPLAAWPLIVAAAVALASCGISPTGVIQAGEPATAQSPSSTLYFLVRGRLVAVPRLTPGADVATAVRALFGGPSSAESAKGLVTELPALPTSPVVQTGTAS